VDVLPSGCSSVDEVEEEVVIEAVEERGAITVVVDPPVRHAPEWVVVDFALVLGEEVRDVGYGTKTSRVTVGRSSSSRPGSFCARRSTCEEWRNLPKRSRPIAECG
jgi:hypothetical protein